jgi:hypothetical protein
LRSQPAAKDADRTVCEPVSAYLGIAYTARSLSPTLWSGIPSGIFQALRDCGVRVEYLAAEPSQLLGFAARAALTLRWRTKFAAGQSPEFAAIRTRAAGRALAKARRLDAIIQLGTGYTVDTQACLITYEDLTLMEAARYYPVWTSMPKRALDARIKRQQEAYENATVCCTTSHRAAASIITDYGIAREKVRVVGVGANLDAPIVG